MMFKELQGEEEGGGGEKGGGGRRIISMLNFQEFPCLISKLSLPQYDYKYSIKGLKKVIREVEFDCKMPHHVIHPI